ncbi:DUF4345 domain-containing protein [Verrucomicrobiaceae bacterium N1E253]|uniref:DUF4345 domain-containing protein n=1 Tax=Oceaniferula marina TaxID=2748318 RepID=A0A851GHU1_9BACT|nr:DUF4345 domain-containing protein [Oceaniferula marina]NWK56452.1 DUF4345 domain-containing protein [Oceaniferula marina]
MQLNQTPHNKVTKCQKVFLIAAAVGLTPIALSYGVNPSTSLSAMFDLTIESTNGTHIFRAVMGLYLAMVTFWLMGAKNDHFTRPALLSLIVFMLGLAGGRVLSLALDGPGHWLLTGYMLTELAFGFIGIKLLQQNGKCGLKTTQPNS